MIRRAKRLQSIYDEYCDTHDYPQFKLDSTEWRQVDYLLQLTYPFFRYTTILSKTKEVTVHNVFSLYNSLFDHIEISMSRLRRKQLPWKKQILQALEAAKEKLSIYYGKTNQEHGYLYAMSTILAPKFKLQFFSDENWSDNNYEWRDKYLQYLHNYFQPYKERFSNGEPSSRPRSQSSRKYDLDFALTSRDTYSKTHSLGDEISRYLEEGRYPLNS